MASKHRVGQLNTVLTAQTSPFTKGMEAAKRTAMRMSSSVSRAARSMGRGGVGGAASEATRGLVKMRQQTLRSKEAMNRATRSARKFAGGLSSVTSKLGGFGVALSATAGIAGFALLTRNSLASVDALAKTADKLGVTTESLAGLRHAAELSGVASNTLDMALQRMVRRVAEASNGTGEAVSALKELGLDAQRLAQMSPDEQFRAIAEAFGQINNQSDRVRLSFKLFDSEGVALVNTLSMGREGLEAAQREAEGLGLAISRVDAAMIEQANDAVTRMKASLTGLISRITVSLAPVIEGMANSLTKIASVGANIMARYSKFIVPAAAGLAGLVTGFALVKAAAIAYSAVQSIMITKQIAFLGLSGPAGWAAIAAGITLAGVAIAATSSMLGEAADESARLNRHMRDTADLTKSVSEAELKAMREQRRALILSVQEAKKRVQELQSTRYVETQPDFEIGGGTQPHLMRESVGTKEAITEAKREVGKLQLQLRRLDDQLQGSVASFNATRAAVVEFNEQLEKSIATFGMSSSEVKLYELAQRGATEAELEHTRALIAKLEQLERQDRITSYIDKLREQRDTLNLTSEELVRYRLELMGATEEQIAHALSIQRSIDAMRAQADELRALEQAARSVYEQTRTPLERYEKKLTELDELLKRGLISYETYARAVRMAREELEKMAKLEESAKAKQEELRRGEFRQVDLARIALDGVQSQDEASVSRLLESVVEQLREIKRKVADQPVAAVLTLE